MSDHISRGAADPAAAAGVAPRRARRLALALGDPNGIGPEIALKSLAALADDERARITVFGPADVYRRTAAALGLDAVAAGTRLVDVGALPDAAAVPGRIDPAAGAATVAAATAAIQACRRGEVDAVVACPHHETAIARAGISFAGYTPLVEQVCGLPAGSVFMMLVGGGLRIVHATLHEPIRSALDRLTPALVESAVRAGLRACAMMGMPSPTVGVMGINPHASEGGLFGPEDAAIVEPAVRKLQAEGWRVDGPQGADTLLSARRHDFYVAMVHDQGHIPIKLLAPNGASALSIGADVLLSSVGHGSAMDIAGRGVADHGALQRTIALLAGL